MALSNEFREAVEEGKATRVKIMLKDSLLLDSSCKEFDEMLDYATGKIDSLIEQHDGEQFKSSENWDEDYLNDEMVAVVNNFSNERIELLKEVVKKLYPDNDRNPEEANSCDNTTSNGSGDRSAIGSSKIVGGAVAVVGAGVLISGIVIADVPVVVPIIGGLAIGAGAYIFLKK